MQREQPSLEACSMQWRATAFALTLTFTLAPTPTPTPTLTLTLTLTLALARRAFATAWNSIVKALRKSDLLSTNEQVGRRLVAG